MPMTSKTPTLVYADGSCLGNPGGPGGWGVVIVTPDGTHRLSGGDSQTTNNRMEIMAAIEALRALDPGVPVIIRSDSQYLVKTMNDGWRRTKNQDLWQELDHEVARHDVRFEWVRGHAGDALNEEADALAREAAGNAAKSRAPRRLGAAGGVAEATPAVASTATARRAGARQPKGVDSYHDEIDERILERLEPMLEPGERIAKCAVCEQLFVARGDEVHCALIGCQMDRRR